MWRHDRVQVYQTNVDIGAYRDFHISDSKIIEKNKMADAILSEIVLISVPEMDITL